MHYLWLLVVIRLIFYRGHILIFLTGQEEIELLANLLKDCLNGKRITCYHVTVTVFPHYIVIHYHVSYFKFHVL